MTATTTWSQFPPAVDPAQAEAQRPAPHPAVQFLWLWALLGLIPVGSVPHTKETGGVVAMAVVTGLGALGALVVARRWERWWLPFVVVVADGWLVVLLAGRILGTVAVIAGAVACWAILDRRPARLAPIGRSAWAQLLGVSLLGAVIGARFGRYWPLPAVGLVVLVALISAYRPTSSAALTRVVIRGARGLALVVVSVILALVGVVVVLVPWAFQRLLRWDPTWVPRRAGTRWVAVRAANVDARRLWDPDPRVLRSNARRRTHRAVVAVVAVVALVVGFGAYLGQQQRQHDRQTLGTPALADSPWWPEMNQAIDIAYSRSPITSYVGVEMVDATYPGFNVRDGRRQSWQPPVSDDCLPLRVWMFGGSTLFGMGQRDEHTIASELARLAWADGVALEIDNWGVPADTYWMETRRLEQALAEGEDPPDLAVFYDGANDFRVQAQLNATGRGGERLFANDLDWQALPSIERRNAFMARLMDLTRQGPAIDIPEDVVLSPEQIGEFAAKGYAATAQFSAPVLDDAGIDSVHFYQPSRVTRQPPSPDEVPLDAGDEAYKAEIEAAFRANLPDDVVDLSAAMDGSDQPIYWDELHTNELGARLVAEAMWAELAPTITAKAAETGADSCR